MTNARHISPFFLHNLIFLRMSSQNPPLPCCIQEAAVQ